MFKVFLYQFDVILVDLFRLSAFALLEQDLLVGQFHSARNLKEKN
jgi:hypothetical protein